MSEQTPQKPPASTPLWKKVLAWIGAAVAAAGGVTFVLWYWISLDTWVGTKSTELGSTQYCVDFQLGATSVSGNLLTRYSIDPDAFRRDLAKNYRDFIHKVASKFDLNEGIMFEEHIANIPEFERNEMTSFTIFEGTPLLIGTTDMVMAERQTPDEIFATLRVFYFPDKITLYFKHLDKPYTDQVTLYRDEVKDGSRC